MTNTTMTKAELTNTLATGAQMIGAICHWSLREFNVPRADFESQLSAHGLKAAYGKPPSGRRLLRRALADLRGHFGFRRLPGLKDTGGTALLWFHHDANVDKTRADHVWSVSVTERNGRPELVFAPKEGSICPLETADHLCAKVHDAFVAARDNAQTPDLSETLASAMLGVRRDLLWGGVSLRDSGGVYFVAPDTAPRVEAFSDWVQQVAPETRIDVMRLHDDGANRSTVARSAGSGFGAELVELKAGLEEMLTEGNTKSLNARATQFRLLKSRVEMFSGILGDTAAELGEQIAEAQASLQTQIEASFDAPPKREAASAKLSAKDAEIAKLKEELERETANLRAELESLRAKPAAAPTPAPAAPEPTPAPTVPPKAKKAPKAEPAPKVERPRIAKPTKK